MKLSSDDTIAAVATPPGKGGIGIIRVSGAQTSTLARRLVCRRSLPPRRANFVAFLDAAGEAIDQGILLRFEAPASFTGEDMMEVQAHGSPVVLELLMRRLVELGARPAAPGEFSRRAFENGKYDLSQLEAIAGLINSATAQATRSAQRVLRGEFSDQIGKLSEALLQTRVLLESSIDFSDEDLEHTSEEEFRARFKHIADALADLRRRATAGLRLHTGIEAVMVGHPNVGKSSLLNRLAGRDEAIVSDIAGTTRDLLKCELSLDGIPVRLWDTAGLRAPRDAIERDGVERAYAAAANADIVLLVIDAARRDETSGGFARPLAPLQTPCLKVYNKIDLIAPEARDDELLDCGVSAKEGLGLDPLIRRIAGAFEAVGEDALMVQQRHLAALDAAAAALRRGAERLAETELAAEELRGAQQALSAVTGEVTTEALLGEIFSQFCIGK